MKKKIKTFKLKHPIQPIGYSEDGVIRFKENAIIRYMLTAGRQGLKFDLNSLHEMSFSNEDHVQLAQLLGYSVSGFGELSFVPKKIVKKCDKRAFKIYKK